jgi:hypothetical protein
MGRQKHNNQIAGAKYMSIQRNDGCSLAPSMNRRWAQVKHLRPIRGKDHGVGVAEGVVAGGCWLPVG